MPLRHIIVLLASLAAASPAPRFADVTDAVGLGPDVVPETVARLCFADLDADGWPDVVVDRHRVLMSRPDPGSPIGRRFVEIDAERTGLRPPDRSTLTVFADLDNDGWLDAVVAESVPSPVEPDEDHGRRTSIQRGRGDGTFEAPVPIEGLEPATTSAIGVGDVDRDGRLDLWLGNWYVKYGASLDGFPNDLLVQEGADAGTHADTDTDAIAGRPDRIRPIPEERGSSRRGRSERSRQSADAGTHADTVAPAPTAQGPTRVGRVEPGRSRNSEDRPGRGDRSAQESPLRWRLTHLPSVAPAAPAPSDGAEPPDDDPGGRPTYGAMIVDLDDDGRPELLELNYGRRWNRCWTRGGDGASWRDAAPEAGLDGDAIRHGRYPDWLAERAKTDPRFDREDERPFRANGNTFDAAPGDVDGDGELDLLLAEITHGWAGDSSDRSRVLLGRRAETGRLAFEPDDRIDLDRIPPDVQNWNQGDLFGAFADLDQDGRLDVILSSGDYPDDQRLRVFLQQPDGSVRDATSDLGIDHDGSQQISLADVDGDGDLDLLVGQTFMRYGAEQRAGREPHLRLLVNEATEGRRSIVIRLRGDGAKVSRDALGAVVRATLPDGRRLVRQLVAIGGHAGKQHDFVVHLGLGVADRVDELTVVWPDKDRTTQKFEGVAAGRYVLGYGGAMAETAAGR